MERFVTFFSVMDREGLRRLEETYGRHTDSVISDKSRASILLADYLETEIRHLRETCDVTEIDNITIGYDSFLRSMYDTFVASKLTGKKITDVHISPHEEIPGFNFGCKYASNISLDMAKAASSTDVIRASINKYFINKGERVDQPPNSGGHT